MRSEAWAEEAKVRAAGELRVMTSEGGRTTLGSRAERTSGCSAVLLPGNVIGSYRIIENLGEGGMGRVYLAEHVRLGRVVALKVLREEYSDRRELVRRFFDEARAANQIEHENILEITDFAEDSSCNLYYIVMERLKGIDLLELIDREGALPPLRAINIARQIASALHAAHEASIIHRDLKPENVFLTERTGHRDFVKILDFGVAKLLHAQENSPLGISTHQTSPGAMIGTPTYMSPEQACGRELDPTSDVYSLGVIFYEMITGKVPFEGHSFGELVVKHTVMAPPRPSRREDLTYPVDPELEELILRCLEKETSYRPQSMMEIKEALDHIARRLSSSKESSPSAPSIAEQELEEPPDEESVSIVLPDEEEPPEPPRSSKSRLIIGAAAAGGVVVGGVLAAVFIFGAASDATSSVEPPTAAPRAEETERVSVIIETTPAGAKVLASDGETALGVTPLTKSFERSKRRRELIFELDGYVTARSSVELDRDGRVAVSLTPEPTEIREPDASSPAPRVEDPRAAAVSDSPARRSPRGSSARSESRRGDDQRPSPSNRRPEKAPSTENTAAHRRGVIDPFAE